MIKPIIIEKSFTNKTKIPNYWKFMNNVSNELINSDKLIPISNDKGRFKKLILEAIDNATETIMLCSFILSDETIIASLLKAAERKVRIYLLFSTNIQLDKEHKEDPTEFDRKTLEEHKNFLRRIQGKALAHSSELHAKFLLVDYGFNKQIGFISTANFTKEALIRNQELGLILNSMEDIQQLFYFFQRGFWEESTHVFAGDWIPIKERNLKPLSVKDRIISTSKNNQSLKDNIISLINSTTGPLIVSSYSFKSDNNLTNLLIDISLKRNLTVLTRPREINVAALDKFLVKRVNILCYDFIHAKFILAPNENQGIIMSANFDNKGLEIGYEIGVFLDESECNELNNIAKIWIRNAQYKYVASLGIEEINPSIIKIFENNELREYEITPEKIIEQTEKPIDLREIENLKNIKFNGNFTYESIYPKKITIRRNIIPPILPTNSIKIKENPFPFDLYVNKNKRYLVIKNERQLKEAIDKYDKQLSNITLVTG